jgi:hypothetical protein
VFLTHTKLHFIQKSSWCSSPLGEHKYLSTHGKNITVVTTRFHPFLQATKALRESRGIALLCFQASALEGGEGSASRPGRFLPPGKTRYPLYRRLDGPQGRSGRVRKISPPTGIRSPDRPARSHSLYRLSYPAHSSND